MANLNSVFLRHRKILKCKLSFIFSVMKFI